MARATYDYSGSTVVVVGATGALGLVVVQAFLDAGARVIAASRRRGHALPVHPALEFMPLDAGDEDVVAAFFAQVGAPDVLVSVVGGYEAGETVEQLSLATLERLLALNLRPAFLLTKHALQAMRRAGRGRIALVAARAAVERGQNAFAYSASKQAVVRLVEASAAETVQTGITVNCVLPSIIDTPANRAAIPDADPAQWTRPEQIARVLLFLASDDSELISGAAIPIYGRV